MCSVTEFRLPYLTLFLCALLTSCSSSSSDLAVTEVQKSAAFDRLAGAAPADQMQAFDDGTISADEYSEAVLASFACFEKGISGLQLPGVEVTPSPPTRSGVELSWSYRLAVTDELALEDADAEVATIEQRCREQFDYQIVEAYQVGLIPTGEERRAFLTQLVDCAEDSGVDMPDNFTLEKLGEIPDEDLDRFGTCASQFPELFYAVR